MSDYRRDDENEILPRRVKVYGSADTIIDVASDHGLRCEVVRMPDWGDLCVVKVFATRADFKKAQFQWLAKMIQTKVETEIEL